MTDIMEDNAQVLSPPEVSSGVGHRLAEAREKAGMSVEEAAAQLRLGVRQVLALEADDVAALPGPTFVRGFIRNYARLLELDADALLAASRAHMPESGSGVITLHSENIPITNREKKSWLPYLLASVLIAVLSGAWMIYMEYAPQRPKPDEVAAPVMPKETPATVAPTPIQLPAQPAVAEPAAVMPASPDAVPVAAPAPAPAPAATSATPMAPVASPPAAPVTARLGLTFVEASWVSVTDHDGKSVFNKKQLAGNRETVEGVPPFNITVGNASGVQLTFNDKPVDLAPYTKANVARLTLE